MLFFADLIAYTAAEYTVLKTVQKMAAIGFLDAALTIAAPPSKLGTVTPNQLSTSAEWVIQRSIYAKEFWKPKTKALPTK